MSWLDYFSIRLMIALAIITFAVASYLDDTNDGHEILKPFTKKLSNGRNFGIDMKKSSASYDEVDEGEAEKEEEDDGESEREDVDEYEEELRVIAESHEAMSRDDRDNSTDGINHSEISVYPGGISIGTKNFDSREKSVEESSDESMASNEAISSEPVQDTEVKELLKFKRDEKLKIKRVPTVKKELSSQKEIQGNFTQSNATIKIINDLKRKILVGKADPVLSNHVLDNGDTRDKSQIEQRSLQGDSGIKYKYTDLDVASMEILGKVDKRQQSNVKGFEAYPPSTTHAKDLNKQRKLWELESSDALNFRTEHGDEKCRDEIESWISECEQDKGIYHDNVLFPITDKYTFAESLMELLVNLAKNPRHWARAHRLLKDIEDDLNLSRALDSNKHEYHNVVRNTGDLLHQSLLMKEPEQMSKKPKKKKKKKKKLRYQALTTVTMSAIPLTTAIPVIASTEGTTQTHWRLVADRLFKPSWSIQTNDRLLSNMAKVHYGVSSKQLDAPTSNQHDSNSEYINDERSAITNPDFKYPLSRKFHFGKINTHEKGLSLNQHDPIDISSYESDASDTPNSQVLDNDLPDQMYQRSRINGDKYNRYDPYIAEQNRHFNNDYSEDYQDPAAHTTSDFSRYRDYYDKSWKLSQYDMSRTAIPYFDNGPTKWTTRYDPWQLFWQPMVDMKNENSDQSELYGKFGSWPPEKSIKGLPWRSIGQVSQTKEYIHNDDVDNKNRNHSELNDALKSIHEENDNTFMPKITMKTWNSLTSDPATWPFKLSDVKPWPKDKNGKSYNPNADLVRKLGLDKQGHNSKKEQINHTNVQEFTEKIDNMAQENESQNWDKDRKMWPSKILPKIQSVGTWVMPADQPPWKSYEPKQRQSFENDGMLRWPDKTIDDTWQEKLTNWNVEFGKQPSHPATWPSKWKQFSYHKVNVAPITKPGAQLEGTQKTRNAFIAVSAVSPSKYSTNEWRKNDIEELSPVHNLNNVDTNDPTTQLLLSQQKPQKNHWKKQMENSIYDISNGTDLLENQLEELRKNNLEKRNPSTVATYLLSVAMNGSTTSGVNIISEDKVVAKSTEAQTKAQN